MKVMGMKNYFARIKILIGKKEIVYREVDWINTHRLLWKVGYVGGKTGQTTGAGCCLATIYERTTQIKNKFAKIDLNGLENTK